MPLIDAARRANVVAALSVTRAGTQTSFAAESEARAFLAGFGFALFPDGIPAAIDSD
jgi:sugar/nucleoside kinase (ribokinase family)